MRRRHRRLLRGGDARGRASRDCLLELRPEGVVLAPHGASFLVHDLHLREQLGQDVVRRAVAAAADRWAESDAAEAAEAATAAAAAAAASAAEASEGRAVEAAKTAEATAAEGRRAAEAGPDVDDVADVAAVALVHGRLFGEVLLLQALVLLLLELLEPKALRDEPVWSCSRRTPEGAQRCAAGRRARGGVAARAGFEAGVDALEGDCAVAVVAGAALRRSVVIIAHRSVLRARATGGGNTVQTRKKNSCCPVLTRKSERKMFPLAVLIGAAAERIGVPSLATRPPFEPESERKRSPSAAFRKIRNPPRFGGGTDCPTGSGNGRLVATASRAPMKWAARLSSPWQEARA